GIAGGTGDVAGQATTANGSVTTLFQAGADGLQGYSFNPASIGQLPGLTSGGVAVTYAVGANLITASAGGQTVFTMALDAATGAWTFTLSKPLDHALGSDENDLTINFGGLVQATDKDGDTVTATGTVSVTVDDDTPVAVAGTSTGTVDEDGLPGGIAGGTGDVTGEALIATGSVTALFQSGADVPLTYGFNTAGSM